MSKASDVKKAAREASRKAKASGLAADHEAAAELHKEAGESIERWLIARGRSYSEAMAIHGDWEEYHRREVRKARAAKAIER